MPHNSRASDRHASRICGGDKPQTPQQKCWADLNAIGAEHQQGTLSVHSRERRISPPDFFFFLKHLGLDKRHCQRIRISSGTPTRMAVQVRIVEEYPHAFLHQINYAVGGKAMNICARVDRNRRSLNTHPPLERENRQHRAGRRMSGRESNGGQSGRRRCLAIVGPRK